MRCDYEIITFTTTKNRADMKKNSVLNYTTSCINRNFRIKVYGVDNDDRKINKLVGVAGIVALVGVDMLNKLLKRAFNCLLDKCVCKLRRGLQVSFYVK